MGFGSAVRAKRKECGLTLEQLSERTNITPNYLGRVETGKADPSLSVACAIAKALKTNVGDLLGGEKVPADERRTRRQRRPASAEAQEVAALYDALPLDVREATLPAVRTIAARLRRR